MAQFALSNTGSTNGILNPPKQSNIGSFLTLPSNNKTQNSGLTNNGQSVQASVPQGSLQGMINVPKTPTPSTPVKSTTVTHPSGTTVQTSYHAPATNSSSASTSSASSPSSQPQQAAYDASNGFLTAYGKSIGAKPVQPGDPANFSQQVQNGMINPTSGVNANGSTSSSVYSAPDQGVNGVSQGGLIQNLSNQSQNSSQEYKDAQAEAQRVSENAVNYAKDYAKLTNNIAGTAGFLTQQNGEQGLLNNQYNTVQNTLAQQYAGATNRLGAANTQQGLQVQAGTAAGNLNQPLQVPYSSQVINPITGQPVGGGGQASQLPQPAVDFINSLAEQVKSGRMTRPDAESRISQYSQPGLQQLDRALGSNFNTNASNASASTTQQGQQLQTAAHATTQALDSLQVLFNNLPGAQTGGIPATNSVANWIASALGSSALTQYNQTLHDARAQLQGVLTASGGATPTGAEAMAKTYLPDNMTAGQLSAAIANVKNLVQQKVSSFTQSGVQGGSSGNNGGNLFGNFF